MDNLTHRLFGATLARTPLGRAGRGTTAALILASNAPDIDIVTTAGGALSYLEWHRGPTHGPLGVVGLGLVVAALVWGGQRAWSTATRAGGRHASFRSLAAVVDRRRALPRADGPADVVWHAAAQPVRLALVRDRLDADRRHLPAGRARGRLLVRSAAWNRRRRRRNAVDRAVADGGSTTASAVGAHRQALDARAAPVRPAAPGRCERRGQQAHRSIDRWPIPRASVASDDRRAAPCLVEIAAMPTFMSPVSLAADRAVVERATRCGTSTCSSCAASAPTGPEAPWRLRAAYPNRWTPAVRGGRAIARRTDVPRLLTLSRRAFRAVDAGRRRDRPVGPTSASSAAAPRPAGRTQRARLLHRRPSGVDADGRMLDGRAPRRMTTGCHALWARTCRWPAGCRARSSGRVVHRCDALQIFAKNASQWRGRRAASRRRFASSARRVKAVRARAGRLARQLSDQPGDRERRRCATSRSRPWATSSIAPRRSDCSASCCTPAATRRAAKRTGSR